MTPPPSAEDPDARPWQVAVGINVGILLMLSQEETRRWCGDLERDDTRS